MTLKTLLFVFAACVTTLVITPAMAEVHSGKPELDSKTRGSTVRASKLIGMNLENSRGDSVGEINDLVVDADSRQVKYVAVTYGGLLGVGNKMFAVPMEAIKCMTDPDDPDHTLLILNVTQRQLEGAEGFDEDHWPNFADPKFTDGLHRRYGVKNRGVNVDVGKSGVSVELGADRS